MIPAFFLKIDTRSRYLIGAIIILHLLTCFIVKHFFKLRDTDVVLVYLLANLFICNILWAKLTRVKVKHWVFLFMLLFQLVPFWYECLDQRYNWFDNLIIGTGLLLFIQGMCYIVGNKKYLDKKFPA